MTAGKNGAPFEATVDIVEMDALDVGEWEGQQLTPQESDAKLMALVRQTSAVPVVSPPAPTAKLRSTAPAARATPATIRRTPTTLPAVAQTIGSPPKHVIPSVMPKAVVSSAVVPRPIAQPVVPQAIASLTMAPPVIVPAKPVILAPLVMPLPSSDVPHQTISVEADEAPPVSPRVVVAPTPMPLPVVTPTKADITGAGPYSVAEPTPPARTPLLAKPWWRRPVVISGIGAGIIAVVLIAMASSGGGQPITTAETTTPPSHPTPSHEPTITTPPPPVAAIAPPVVAPAALAPTPPPKPTTVAATVPRHRISSKKLVLDYDKPAAAKPTASTKPDDQALAKARASYALGNQRLFAGDPDAAVHAYQESLTLYPAYVAGYRGLGLAYTQLGNKPLALSALRTYVKLVPNAKDIALVKRRIAALSR